MEKEPAKQIVETTTRIMRELKPNDALIFLGRDSIFHYTTARKLAEPLKINRNNIKLLQTGKFLNHINEIFPGQKNTENLHNFQKQVQKLGLEKTIEKNGKITIIDTGVGGSQPEALEKILHSIYPGIKTEKKLIISANPYIQGIELNVPTHLKEDKIRKILEKRNRKKTPLEIKKFIKKYHLNAKIETRSIRTALNQLSERRLEFKKKAFQKVLKIENLPKLTPPVSGYNEKGKPEYKGGSNEPGEPQPNLQQYREFNEKLEQTIQKQIQKLSKPRGP